MTLEEEIAILAAILAAPTSQTEPALRDAIERAKSLCTLVQENT